MFESLGKVIMPLIIIAVLYLLYKKGILKSMPLPTLAYSDLKGRRTLKTKYSQLRDAKVYNYMLKKNEPLSFTYEVTVNEGSLRLRLRSKSGDIFDNTFTASAKGSVELTPKTKLHSIVLNGKNASGKCHCEFRKI